MRRLGTFLSCGAFVAAAFGCNAILENEPGRLDRGASASGAGGTSGGASSGDIGGSESEGEGAAPISGGNQQPDAGATPGVPDTSGTNCAVGSKACGGLCVSADDPFFGCADLACNRCEVPNATAACVVGTCGVGACVPGFADCNGLPADGCEASLQTVNDCGACGMKCPMLENADMACVGGACAGTCVAGFGDCNGKPEDGCEKNLLKDRNNCGGCGNRCVFGKCEQGVCVW
jgi:hypothetical protein